MSKLDNIILECANKVQDGKQEKLGDYIDPTKQQIKELFLELIGKQDTSHLEAGLPVTTEYLKRSQWQAELRQKVNEL